MAESSSHASYSIMKFNYSITQGIAVGFLTYTLTKVVKGQARICTRNDLVLDLVYP